MPASYAPSREDILRRLRKVEGQVKGIQKMVDQDQYCVDVLTQIAAARAALDRVGGIVFEHHTRGCLKRAIRDGREDEMIEELLSVLKKFMT